MPSNEMEARAKELVSQYNFEFKLRGDTFIGFTRELPGVTGLGKSFEQCRDATMEAQVATVAALLRKGLAVPEAGENKSEQLNLRLTREDKDVLQLAAGKGGYRSVSEFVRKAALEAAKKIAS
ncbi:MAG: DUF1778 domain-containing protein [Planctomycetota bacterium]|nr:DUF1778 domain-containing protein [Planctomycetota bacterium]